MVDSKENDKFNLGVKGLKQDNYIYLNPLTSESDWLLIYSYNITFESNIEIMTKKKGKMTNSQSSC